MSASNEETYTSGSTHKITGDRMKSYELVTTGIKFNREDIVIARLDGRSFSKFTSSLKRKTDERQAIAFNEGFMLSMIDLTKYLTKEYGAVVSFTQSDEISLVFINNETSQHPFGGKIFKMQSLMAADASSYYNELLSKYLPEKVGTRPMFDCRVFSVPTKEEAIVNILWRRLDGLRNSISAVARLYYSDKQLHKKNKDEQLAMLKEKGVNFETDYQSVYQTGALFTNAVVEIPFTTEEINKLPLKHKARLDPDMLLKRHQVISITFDDIEDHLNRK